MAVDPGAVLKLTAALARLKELARTAGIAPPETAGLEEPFTVALAGPVDSGKTAFVRALLDDPVECLRERPGRDTQAPVFYTYANNLRVFVDTGSMFAMAEFDPSCGTVWDRRDIQGVRVELPAPVLREWGLRIADLPSVEFGNARYARALEGLARDRTGVIYMLPDRGASDVDVEWLDRLHREGWPLIVMENVRESDLKPHRSLLECVPESCSRIFPYRIPLLLFRVEGEQRRQGDPEREITRLCAALLRSAAVPKAHLTQMRANLEEMGGRLPQEARRILNSVHQRSRQSRPLQALQTLLDLEERLLPAYRQVQSELNQIEQHAHPDKHLLSEHLQTKVRERVDYYNIEAGSSRADATPNASAPTGQTGHDFCQRFVEERRQLRGHLDNMLTESPSLGLTDAESASLNEYRQKLASDCLEIALLGRFSSGKSALVNALMGVKIEDQKSGLLPTATRTETATVTRLEYSVQKELKAIRWRATTDLTFLTKIADGRIKVHTREMQAFQIWLTRNEVSLSHCQFLFEPSSEGRKVPLSRRRTRATSNDPFGMLNEWVGKRDFIPPEDAPPDEPIPMGVRINQFNGPRPSGWPEKLKVSEAFERAKAPEIALRVEELVLGFNHPLLQYLSIIDTPGTDSTEPHHKQMAHRIIRDLGCPVIYCIPGSQAWGTADTQNLKQLTEWGISKDTANLDRFYFVVTRRGDVNASGQQEVVLHTQSRLESLLGVEAVKLLAERGSSSRRGSFLYFTEVANEKNQDFLDLVEDLEAHVTRSREDLVPECIGGTLALLSQVRERHRRSAETNEGNRQLRRTELQRQDKLVKELVRQLDSSDKWGHAWARGRIDCAQENSHGLADNVRSIDRELTGLTTKDAYKGLDETLSDLLLRLNKTAKKVLPNVCGAIGSKLQTLVAKELCCDALGIRRTFTPPGAVLRDDDPDPFLGSAVLEAVSKVEWGGFWRKTWDWVFGADEKTRENRDRIQKAWKNARGKGIKSLEKCLQNYVLSLHGELDRVRSDIEQELVDLESEKTEAELKAILARGDRAQVWLGRLEALQCRLKKGKK